MVSYNGFNSQSVTISKSNIDVDFTGKVVDLCSGGYVDAAEQDADFIGVCVSDKGTYAGVQLEGYVECQYSGSAPNYGWVKLVADEDGKVVVGKTAGAPMRRVVKVDDINNVVGFIL